MNEPSKQKTYWRYHCSASYIIQQWRSYHENFSFIVTYLSRHRATIMPAKMPANGNFNDTGLEQFYSVRINHMMSLNDTVDLGRPHNSLFEF